MSLYHESPFVFEHPNRIVIVEDEEVVDIGNGLRAKAIFTPGHNPSCISWLAEDCLFTGDSYIPGIKTVTNLPGGNRQQADQSKELIKRLGEDHIIWPGHMI